jgi:hypothetical protein
MPNLNIYRKWALLLAATIFILLVAVSCAGPSQEQPTPNQNQPEGAPTPAEQAQPSTPEAGAASKPAEQASTEPKTQEEIQVDWQSGPHASTYVLSAEGTNSSCARCHAPIDWIPAMDEMPQSCYACKFEIAPPPPVIEEANWQSISCKVCHQVKKGKVQTEISWLEVPPIEDYSKVESVNELCFKCHVPDEAPGHAGVSLGGAHAEMSCTDCHDSHTMTASCATSGCHTEMEAATEPIPGHDADHENIACAACHDADGMEVGPDADGIWQVLKVVNEGEPGVPASSHNTVREAPCERCHYADNPWGLSVETAGSMP